MNISAINRHLVDESRLNGATSLRLKRLILRATDASLKYEIPNHFFEKCHVAAVSNFVILRELGIVGELCTGEVRWQFGGVDASGISKETTGGFWTTAADLEPHYWVETEFREIIDLTCSYYHHTIRDRLHGFQTFDQIAPIWMRMDELKALSRLAYTTRSRQGKVDLEGCDGLVRQVVSRAVAAFEAESDTVSEADPFIQQPLLSDSVALREMLPLNTWMQRNR